MEHPPKKDSTKKDNEKNTVSWGKLVALTALSTFAIANQSSATEKETLSTLNNHELTITGKDSTTADKNPFKGEIHYSGNKIEVNLANFFETDKAEVTEEDKKQIRGLIKEYLDNISQGNIDGFLASNVILNGSSDERKTNSYSDGNFGLTKSRLTVIKKIINETLQNIDFSKTNLTPTQVGHVIEKFQKITESIPMTKDKFGRGENGVLDYSEVINEETNKPFTSLEWENLHKPGNESKLDSVYKRMRKVSLYFEMLSKYEGDIPNMEKYKEMILYFDASPSMSASKETLAKTLRDNQSYGTSRNVLIKTFTNTVEDSLMAKDQKEAADILEKLDLVGKNKELAIHIMREDLEKIPNDGKERYVMLLTDEPLQDVDINDINKLLFLSQEKKITIDIVVKINDQKHTLNLHQLWEIHNKIHTENVAHWKRAIQISKEAIKNMKNQKDIDKEQELIQGFEAALSGSHVFDISDFSNIAKNEVAKAN